MSRAGHGDALQDTELDVLKKLAVDVENVTVYRNQVFLRVPELKKPGFLWACVLQLSTSVSGKVKALLDAFCLALWGISICLLLSGFSDT